jgi:hypothetical protein
VAVLAYAAVTTLQRSSATVDTVRARGPAASCCCHAGACDHQASRAFIHELFWSCSRCDALPRCDAFVA